MMDMKIGWIGAGKMGGPMSCNIMTAGGQVTVFDPVPENVVGVVAAGGTAAASNVALAADSEIVFSMIPNDAVLRLSLIHI